MSTHLSITSAKKEAQENSGLGACSRVRQTRSSCSSVSLNSSETLGNILTSLTSDLPSMKCSKYLLFMRIRWKFFFFLFLPFFLNLLSFFLNFLSSFLSFSPSFLPSFLSLYFFDCPCGSWKSWARDRI